MKRIISVLAAMAIVAAMVAAMAVPAFALGKTEQGVDHARSICSYSGLNDEFVEGDVSAPRTQSYGEIVKQGAKAFVPSPGDACNPTKGFAE